MNLKQTAVWVFCMVCLLQSQNISAQTSYLDNTGQPITATGSSSFTHAGEQFQTGTNAGGYILNGLQLLFAVAQGSPVQFYLECFILSGYSNSPAVQLPRLFIPNDNPTTAGLHTYVSSQLLFDPIT